MSSIHPAGAKAFEWKQEIGINQARRTGQLAILTATSSPARISGKLSFSPHIVIFVYADLTSSLNHPLHAANNLPMDDMQIFAKECRSL